MVGRRQDMSFGSPGIVDAVVCQCGKIRWCGVVVETTILPFGV
jgi:hypothetical protein